MKGIIIGAGIAGLTAAIALQRRGFDIQVYESASELQPIGAGIWIAPNGMAVLQRIDSRLDDDVRDAGKTLLTLDIVNHKGKILQRIKYEDCIERYGYGTTAIHRGVLQKILLSYVQANTVHLNKMCMETGHLPGGDVFARFADGSTVQGDFLLGADGLHSVARKYVAGHVPFRYSGQTCWRGITEFILPPEYRDGMVEIWGKHKGMRVAFSQVSSTKVYFYLTQYLPAGGKDDPATLKDFLHDLYKEFTPVFHDILRACDANQIIRTDLYDFAPLTQWTKGRIALLGDSIHATTPNLGQGGNQALESAYVLADCLAECNTPMQLHDAYQKYTHIRMKKAHKITKLSWQLAQMVNIESGFWQGIRNAFIKSTPHFVAEKQLDDIYRLNF